MCEMVFNVQALMYPLLVACKSISTLRRQSAQQVVDKVRQHSGILVDQAFPLNLKILIQPFPNCFVGIVYWRSSYSLNFTVNSWQV